MKPLAIIPARAGSKRLPHKNRQLIDGMSLAQHAIRQAQHSGLFDHVILSTDDQWLLDQPMEVGPLYVHDRPAYLAGDQTPMIDVVRAVVDKARGWHMDFDMVVLLQPTSPQRTSDDIKAACEIFDQHHAEALISVVETRNPEVFTMGVAGRLRSVALHVDGRRMVVPNGAIYIISAAVLERGRDWWSANHTYAYEMPPERSIDIDTEIDLEKVRTLWKR